MRESMRFYYVAQSMKRIEIPLSHIRDKNKFKSRDSLFPLVQCFKKIGRASCRERVCLPV